MGVGDTGMGHEVSCVSTYLIGQEAWVPHHFMVEDKPVAKARKEEIKQVYANDCDYG